MGEGVLKNLEVFRKWTGRKGEWLGNERITASSNVRKGARYRIEAKTRRCAKTKRNADTKKESGRGKDHRIKIGKPTE